MYLRYMLPWSGRHSEVSAAASRALRYLPSPAVSHRRNSVLCGLWFANVRRIDNRPLPLPPHSRPLIETYTLAGDCCGRGVPIWSLRAAMPAATRTRRRSYNKLQNNNTFAAVVGSKKGLTLIESARAVKRILYTKECSAGWAPCVRFLIVSHLCMAALASLVI